MGSAISKAQEPTTVTTPPRTAAALTHTYSNSGPHLEASPSATRKRRLPQMTDHGDNDEHRERDPSSGLTGSDNVDSNVDNPHASKINNNQCKLDTTPDGEIHRYRVESGPLYWSKRKDIVKLLSKLSKPLPPYTGLQKAVKKQYFFITFPNAACAKYATDILSSHTHRNQQWTVERMAQQPFKRQRFDTDNNRDSSRGREAFNSDNIEDKKDEKDDDDDNDNDNDNNDNPDNNKKADDQFIGRGTEVMRYPTAADATATWRDVPYSEQIERKTEKICTALRDVTRQLRKEVKPLDSLPWLLNSIKAHRRSNNNNNNTNTATNTPGSDPFSEKRQFQQLYQNYPMCCSFERIITAPDEVGIREYYRNKNEMTVGFPPPKTGIDCDHNREENKDAVIGYALGQMRKGHFCVGAVDKDCKATSHLSIDVASTLTPVIRASKLPPYDRYSHKGYWRQVTVRESARSGHALITIAVNPDYFNEQQENGAKIAENNSSVTNDIGNTMAFTTPLTDKEMQNACMTNEDDMNCRKEVVAALLKLFATRHEHAVRDDDDAVGIFWQYSSAISSVANDAPMLHLHGLQALNETLQPASVLTMPLLSTSTSTPSAIPMTPTSPTSSSQLTATPSNTPKKAVALAPKLKLRVQPAAFFQVNTFMADILYGLIGDIANVTKDVAVLDVCCGTGTIGLSLASRAKHVVGIEINESAVLDAQFNAKLNNITNASFLVGRAETCIHDAIKLINKEAGSARECVVILDPPRAGIPNNVIAAIRAMPAVKRVVYVACEPANFWKNALGFCRPSSKAFRLQPFAPVRAYGVDLFPQTQHTEMVVMLERIEGDFGGNEKYKGTNNRV